MDAEMNRVRDNVIRQLQPMLAQLSRGSVRSQEIIREAERRVEQASGGQLMVDAASVRQETGRAPQLILALRRGRLSR